MLRGLEFLLRLLFYFSPWSIFFITECPVNFPLEFGWMVGAGKGPISSSICHTPGRCIVGLSLNLMEELESISHIKWVPSLSLCCPFTEWHCCCLPSSLLLHVLVVSQDLDICSPRRSTQIFIFTFVKLVLVLQSLVCRRASSPLILPGTVVDMLGSVFSASGKYRSGFSGISGREQRNRAGWLGCRHIGSSPDKDLYRNYKVWVFSMKMDLSESLLPAA